MNTVRICQSCKKPLPADAPEGLCPECLVKVALGSGVDPSATPSSAPTNPSPAAGFASAETLSPEAVAKLFPQLEILELLGQGGMGVVYKARQKQLDRIVALKIMLPQFSRDPAFVERFNREARALAKLNHPNIVAIYDFGQTAAPQTLDAIPHPPLCFFIMEFVDGANLRSVIQSGKLTAPEALAIVPKLCDALQFAHDEGVVHRDIKPANILVDKRGRVKIADFGLAKLAGATDVSLTRSQQGMGTPQYMAPEQLSDAKSVDHRADIYSLGVVFYEMLTGELPMGRFALPSQKVQIDVRLDEIVLKALEREPARRYQHASEVRTQVDIVTSTSRFEPASKGVTLPADIPTPASVSGPKPLSNFLRSMLWLVVVIGAVMFFDWDNLDVRPKMETDPTYILHTVRIGLVQPWLILMDDDQGHSFYAPNFLTVSAFCGLAALTAGIALFCFRRRKQPVVNEPRLSRGAIAGAVWAVFGLLVAGPVLFFVALNRVLNGKAQPTDFIHEMPWMWVTVFMGVLLVLGVTAPIGTTILGAVSVGKIKRSGGKLYGLPLAAFDLLLFPLLTLGAATFGLLFFIFRAVTVDWVWIPGTPEHPPGTAFQHFWNAFVALDIIASLVACFFAGRAAWRKIAGVEAPDSSKPFAGSTGHLVLNVLLSVFTLWFVLEFGFPVAQMITGPDIRLIEVGRQWNLGTTVDSIFSKLAALAALLAIGNFFAWRSFRKAAARSGPIAAPAPAQPLDHRVSEALTVGLPGWFNRRASWVQKLIQAVLTIIVACATMVFLGFNIQSKTDVTADQVVTNSGAIQVGMPWPWFTLDFSSTHHGYSIHWLSASLWIGLVGVAVGCLSERLRRSRPGFDEVADRRKRRRWMVVMVVVAVLYVAGLVVNALIMSGATGKAARGVMDRAANSVPALGTITDGFGAEFTVPAGQVAIFEIVTRKNGATVPIPNLAAYVVAPSGQPSKGTFRWSREVVDFSSGQRRQPWRIEVRTPGDGKVSSGGLDLPEALEPVVGSMGLGLGLGLKPDDENIHWTGPNQDNPPADGLVGLRVRTQAHGIKAGDPGSAGASGAATTNWMKGAKANPAK